MQTEINTQESGAKSTTPELLLNKVNLAPAASVVEAMRVSITTWGRMHNLKEGKDYALVITGCQTHLLIKRSYTPTFQREMGPVLRGFGWTLDSRVQRHRIPAAELELLALPVHSEDVAVQGATPDGR